MYWKHRRSYKIVATLLGCSLCSTAVQKNGVMTYNLRITGMFSSISTYLLHNVQFIVANTLSYNESEYPAVSISGFTEVEQTLKGKRYLMIKTVNIEVECYYTDENETILPYIVSE